jgi:tRNA pseudouridine55 synthase
LSELRRLASGDFTLEAAWTLERLAVLAADGRLAESLIPASQLLPQMSATIVDEITEGHIRNGREFRTSGFTATAARYVKAISVSGNLVAIGESRLPHLYHPVLVL